MLAYPARDSMLVAVSTVSAVCSMLAPKNLFHINEALIASRANSNRSSLDVSWHTKCTPTRENRKLQNELT